MGFVFDIGVEDGESLTGLELALRKLPISINDEIHIKALKKAGKVLEWEIAGTTPQKTGLLLSDLRVAKSRFKRLNEYQVIVGFRKRRGGHGYIAHLIEYGTSKSPANPFMRHADSKTRKYQEAIYEEEIQKEVDKRLNGL